MWASVNTVWSPSCPDQPGSAPPASTTIRTAFTPSMRSRRRLELRHVFVTLLLGPPVSRTLRDARHIGLK